MPRTKAVPTTSEERKQLLDRVSGGSEPTIDPIKYQTSLVRALNWYNLNKEKKDRKNYAVTYAKKVLGIDVSHVPDSAFITVGFLARLASRSQYLSESDIQHLNKELGRLCQMFQPTKDEVVIAPKPQVPVIDPVEKAALPFIQEFEEAMDANIYNPGAIEKSPDFLKACTNAKALKLVKEHIQKRLDEFTELREGKDEQLNEGYNFINRRKQNHILTFLTELVSAASTQAAVTKVRKPRAKKQKPASVIVKSLRYQKKCDDLKIESIAPETIVGSSMVVLFNTKRRTLTVVEALDGQTLTVKGTTIINNDPEKTVTKILRKPEEQLKSFYKATKRNVATAWKTIKTTERKSASRTAEEVLIVSVNR